jgi:hypothetical protein
VNTRDEAGRYVRSKFKPRVTEKPEDEEPSADKDGRVLRRSGSN